MSSKYLSLFIVILSLLPSKGYSCATQRCCLITPCTTTYCLQRNSQTWNSTQNYAIYGYTKLVLSTSSCLPCPYNCQSCTSQTVCNVCAAGFYMSSSQCVICSYMCSTCVVINSISKCSVCSAGTYLDSSTSSCSNCGSGAQTCSSATVITKCNSGYLLTSNSLFCLPCPSNCQSCPSSSTVCASCNSGYYLRSSACSICTGSNCLTCSFVSSNQVCTTCSKGYYLKSGSCLSCPSNCATCSATTCTTCNQGYFLISGGCLSPSTTISNCNIYNSSTSCSTCLSGYFLALSLCQSCSMLCTSCYDIHFGQCSACISSATLFNQMCLVNNYLSNNIYQLYFSYPPQASFFTGGISDCNHYLYKGISISLNLANMAGSNIRLSWRLFSLSGSTTYNVSLSNSAGSESNIFSTSSSLGQTYSLCSSNSSISYSLSIGSYNFSSIKMTNSLTFNTNNGISLALQQVLVIVQMCNPLCVQCSQVLCTQCLMSNLFTQDAYCVYTCSSGYYIFDNSSNIFNPKSCVQTCPVGTYALSTNLSCAICVSPCLSCLNDLFCLSCIQGYFLTPDNTCSVLCPYRYYGESLTQTCQKCSGRCNECLDQQRCLNCKTGFYYPSNYSCLDSCSPSVGLIGYYANLNSMTCTTCDSSCLNCLISSTYCTSCPSGYLFFNNTCINSCPTGYYQDSNSICQSCSYPCENCLSSASNCTSCVDRYIINNQCLSNCPVGYFEDNVGLKCTLCGIGCKQCTSTAFYCTQCLSGYYLFNNTCTNSCPAQYYINSTLNLCLGCSGLCYNCLNQTFCLSCSSNFLWQGSCIESSQCPSNYYASITTLQCLICSSSCLGCQYSPSNCISCNVNSTLKYLQVNVCLQNCSSTSYYPTVISGVALCNLCVSPCLTCSNATQCLSCVDGYMFFAGLCSTSCSAGSFFNKSIVGCSSCSMNCLICTEISFCQLCQSGYYVKSLNSTSNTCLNQCPNGYYANTISGSCQICLFPCQNCTSSIDCVTCQSGALYLNRCISSCPDTTYLDAINNVCSDCKPPCLTCFNVQTYCVTCQQSYYLQNINSTCNLVCPAGTYPQPVTQMCLQCPTSCNQCLNETFCTVCIPNRTYLYLKTHNCISSCPLGYFTNATTSFCDICSSNCLTCSLSASNCLSCSQSYYLIKRTVTSFDCVTSCPSGYYIQSQICELCIFPCSTCSSASQCVTCVTGTYFYANASSCLLSCPGNTYIDSVSISCQSCTSPCSSCKSPTYCLSCLNKLYLNNGNCISKCPQEYYSDNTLICQKCSGLCQTCREKYYCLSCLTGYLSNGFCYNSCPPGTYANLNLSACIPCVSPCVQCSFSASYCSRCELGLVQYQGNCTSTCPINTYVSDSSCLECLFPCTNCTGTQVCFQCLGGYLLYNGITCIVDATFCPNNFYKMDGKYCIPQSQCPSNYFIDQDLRICSQSCPLQKYVNKDSKTCIYNCLSSQYVGVGMVCHNYTNPPISLMYMSAISYIKSSVVMIYVSFNESEIWLNSSTSIYTIISQYRLLITASQKQTLNYTFSVNDPTTLLLRVTSIPSSILLMLPAYNLVSAASSYPLQNSNITLALPAFLPYEYSAIYQGYTARQFGVGLGWFILLLSLVFLFKNRISHLYALWDTVQLLYVLLFLQIQYPPTLNQFLNGLSTTLFMNFPNIFYTSEKSLTVSDNAFYAYAVDNNFLRNAGPSLTLLLIVIIFYLVLKTWQFLIKKVNKINECMEHVPRLKKFIYEMLLRYRWHYASDIIFLTYISICLFSVAQLYYIFSNPSRGISNTICIISLLVYILFPIFAGIKLIRHFPNIRKGKHSQNLRCFYRGIDKTSKFGVMLIVIRYFRKLVYALVIGIFSSKPMYAVPILMFTSVLMALFIFMNLPYKKRLSNITEIINEIAISMLFLAIAVINFNNQSGNMSLNIIIGYICFILLIIILLLQVFQIFCRALFNLESEQQLKKKNTQKPFEALSEGQLKKKAGEFFDLMFPRIRQQFNFGQDSQDQVHHYEEGDSQNSQNNQQRQRQWGIQSSAHSEQFRHYDNNSDSQQVTQPKKQAPQFLIRCVKELQ